ncbi:outer membrane protein with beta-barrel domain [Dysgonomonas alginatilytica]|uniref:Outer membrane protein with beta-barrel domain n=1 Tax=Dysgonomonas alginatilytica TaxID=1605892 RepID=A0A2V3PVP9_9BACT|nr:porin family protein [Dysgonomonas alginatilytica]PXV69202.1 outer membrane protein with beta-barrel domain [Dysgonomonas alginatilytica]
MKKYAALGMLIVLLITCLNLQAQSQISYAIKAGANFSNSTHQNMNSDMNSRMGYHFGLIAHKQYSDHFFLRSGIEFTAKGAKGDVQWTNNPESSTYPSESIQSWTYRLNYLQIPILAGYKYSLSSSTKLLINAGPYLSYGIYAREKYIYSYYKLPQYLPYTLTHTTIQKKGFGDAGLDKFDFGIIGGIGIEYNQYLLNINYEAGVLNLMSGYDGGNPSWKNQNITISVGYFFKK